MQEVARENRMKDGAQTESAGLPAIAEEELGAPPRQAPSPFFKYMEPLLYLAFVLGAGLMRFWDLGSRAMHHDESLHVIYSMYLFNGQGYQHNPMMHGPFQFHGNTLMFFLFGINDYSARILYALFGTALVAMPYLLRKQLGRTGALFTSFLLAVSPTLFYFSRFARNDILMAVWTLGVIFSIWRYLEERKPAYLFLLAAFLSLAFSTKETAFVFTVIVSSFLFLISVKEFVLCLLRRRSLSQLSPPGVLFLFVATITLPLWSAAVSLFQGQLGVVLSNPDWTKGAVGAPLTTSGMSIAAVVVVFLFAIGALLGTAWNTRLWLTCFGIFYGIYLLLYTSFFTNLPGLASGIWQSLGYWVAQQDVARGGQPWYYYLVLTPFYEFLPLAFGLVGLMYYSLKGKNFELFLVYWTMMSYILLGFAGEKMPWLMVNLALPLALLAGKFLGDIFQSVTWRRLFAPRSLAFILLVPLFTLVLAALFRPQFYSQGWLQTTGTVTIAAVLLAILAVLAYLGFRMGLRAAAQMFSVAVLVLLAPFSFRTGWQASYVNGDVPKEMLVYTQTSADIPRITQQIKELADKTGERENMPITVDSSDGLSWPWVWYLRDFKRVEYPCLSSEPGCLPLSGPPTGKVLLLNARNEYLAKPYLDQYGPGITFRHRWWFPEEEYRNMTVKSLAQLLTTRQGWDRLWNYFIYRKLEKPLGSADAIVYFPRDFQP